MKCCYLLMLSLLSMWMLVPHSATAQQFERDEKAMIENFKGLQYMLKDSTFYINFRFRMQNRLGYYSKSATDLNVDRWEARVRRLRLRFDGFVLTKKLAYSIQLSFSRGDQDAENTGVANIVRDAVIYYKPNPKLHFAFGLNKLPGNRQRVNSSGQLQFAERSIVNSALTLDRDFGIKVYYYGNIGNFLYNLKGAISTGEGRSPIFTSAGLAYTGRVEFLPLGKFKDDGDYSEGDLEREPTPKLSIAAGYSYNHKSSRSGGQLGKELYEERSMGTIIVDMCFKYRGWAYNAEFLKRTVNNPYTMNDQGDVRYAYAGQGTNHQVSYCFPRMYEIAFRYSWLDPAKSISTSEKIKEILELGATKYLRKHRIKVQLSTFYDIRGHDYSIHNPKNSWGGLFQVELGI
ncbi:hypothetical protein BH09BAC1_BH09BAC1_19970 [soil metagenome]